jgi:hypothetical protein
VQNRELTPEQQAGFDRVKAGSRVDPSVVGVLMRAAEVAQRNGNDTVTLKEVLEVLLHCAITPALINHLQTARAVVEDMRGEVVFDGDTEVLAAQLSDGSRMVWQILERHVTDMDALVADISRRVRENPDTP